MPDGTSFQPDRDQRLIDPKEPGTFQPVIGKSEDKAPYADRKIYINSGLSPKPYENLLAEALPHKEDLVRQEDLIIEKRVFGVNDQTDKPKPVGYTIIQAKDFKEGEIHEDIITIVAFHGANGNEHFVLPFGRLLKPPEKFRIIAISAPAHGDTFIPGSIDTFQSWMDHDVKKVLEKEGVTENIIAMGSSMGGLEALWLAKNMPGKVLGCILDKPLIDPVSNGVAVRVGGDLVKGTAVHTIEGTEANRDEFYGNTNKNIQGLYQVDYDKIRRRSEDGNITIGNETPGTVDTKNLPSIIRFLGTIPKDFIGEIQDLGSDKSENAPDFFLLLGRRDEATKTYTRRHEIAAKIRNLLSLQYKESPETGEKLDDKIMTKSEKGSHMAGYQRPWRFYADHYNAIMMVATKFWEKSLAIKTSTAQQ